MFCKKQWLLQEKKNDFTLILFIYFLNILIKLVYFKMAQFK